MKRVVTERKQPSKPIYQSHEKKLVWLSFVVAAVMLLSIIGRLVSG